MRITGDGVVVLDTRSWTYRDGRREIRQGDDRLYPMAKKVAPSLSLVRVTAQEHKALKEVGFDRLSDREARSTGDRR